MMMSLADVLTTPEQHLRKYVQSLVGLLASLNPELFPDNGVTICLWKDHTGMCFDVQFAERFSLFLLV